MTNAVLELLKRRRSVKPDMLAEPGPSPAELDELLTIASRVPDHKKLVPWRFIVFQGDMRAKFGEQIADACRAEDKVEPSEVRLAAERARFMRAPVVIALISRATPKAPAPEWEQILSAGAAGMNLSIAANAMGYGVCWLTEWLAYSPRIKAALGLDEQERVAGFIYIGTPTQRPDERPRPELSSIVSRWQG
ncbi:MAG: nitroreductase [Hyphomicrobiaceae bacterium]|nr:nitroreductase [Hyphomicrobiaceae bacterium]